MQDSLFLLPFFSKKVRQKFHLLHIFKFLNHVSPNVWFQSRKATNVPWVIEEKDLTKDKLKEEINKLLTNEKLYKEISENAKKMSIDNSSTLIYEKIKELIKE